MTQLNEVKARANSEHERCQAEFESYINAGGKVTYEVKPKKIKGSINVRSLPGKRDTPVLAGLNSLAKVEAVLKHYGKLTTTQLEANSGLSKSLSVQKANLLIEKGIVKVEKSGGMGSENTYKWVGLCAGS